MFITSLAAPDLGTYDDPILSRFTCGAQACLRLAGCPVGVARAEPKPGSETGRTRVDAGRVAARIVKFASVSAAVAGLGVFALLARATHRGGLKRVSTLPALAAPASFARALDTGLAPGSVGPAAGAAQTVSGGS